LFTYLVLTAFAITTLMPLVWVVSTSLKKEGAVFLPPQVYVPRTRNPFVWVRTVCGNLREFVAEMAPREQLTLAVAGRRLPLFRLDRKELVVLQRQTPAGSLVAPVAQAAVVGPSMLVSPSRLVPERVIRLHWHNYADAWRAIRLHGFRLFGRLPINEAFLLYFLNSLFVAALVTLGQVFTSSLAGYAFARLRFPGRDQIFLAYLGTMMVPFMVMTIPVFILMRQLRLIDTYAALIVPGMFSAYGTFMLRQFFLSIPRELEDAGRIDGCGAWGIYRHLILPLSKPALATLTTFTFLGTWNEFLWPLLVVNSETMKTVPLGLRTFEGMYAATQWSKLMAASLLFILPVVVVFLVNQRFFIRGIVLSGMKG